MPRTQSAEAHPFDRATRLQRGAGDRTIGETSPAYWNFAGPFGGITAAVMLKAVLDDPRRQGTPVALTVNYCGAIQQGAFDLTVIPERTGRTTQHWSVRLTQGDTVASTASVVTAVRAESFAHQVAVMPSMPAPEQVPQAPTPPHLPWLNSYAFRFVEGPAFSAGRRAEHSGGQLGGSRTSMYLADQPPRPLDYLALAALGDAFILRLVQMRGAMVPMSTVSLTTYFHATEAEVAAQGVEPLIGIADGSRFEANFHDQQMQLFGRGGRLLASGIQTVWYRE